MLYYCKSLNTIELPPSPLKQRKRNTKKKTLKKKEKQKNPLRCFSKTAYAYA